MRAMCHVYELPYHLKEATWCSDNNNNSCKHKLYQVCDHVFRRAIEYNRMQTPCMEIIGKYTSFDQSYGGHDLENLKDRVYSRTRSCFVCFKFHYYGFFLEHYLPFQA